MYFVEVSLCDSVFLAPNFRSNGFGYIPKIMTKWHDKQSDAVGLKPKAKINIISALESTGLEDLNKNYINWINTQLKSFIYTSVMFKHHYEPKFHAFISPFKSA